MKKPTIGSVDLPIADEEVATTTATADAPAAADAPNAPAAPDIEHPQEGGSYVRNPDGSLTRNEKEA